MDAWHHLASLHPLTKQQCLPGSSSCVLPTPPPLCCIHCSRDSTACSPPAACWMGWLLAVPCLISPGSVPCIKQDLPDSYQKDALRSLQTAVSFRARNDLSHTRTCHLTSPPLLASSSPTLARRLRLLLPLMLLQLSRQLVLITSRACHRWWWSSW